MATVIDHNVETGEIVERYENATEMEQREIDLASALEIQEVESEAKAKRESVLAALAAAAGLDVEEVKEALNV